MMSSTKEIGSKGEIVIPKEIRKKYGIKPKQKVEIIGFENGILIVPLVKNIKELRGLFKKEGYKHEKDVDDILFRVMAGI